MLIWMAVDMRIELELLSAVTLIVIGANMINVGLILGNNRNIYYGGIVVAIVGAVLGGMTVVKYIVSGTV